MDNHDNSDERSRAGHNSPANPFQAWLNGDDAALDCRRQFEPYDSWEDVEPTGDSPPPQAAYLESKQKYCPADKEQDTPVEFDSFYEIHPCRCKSRFCPSCCVGLGIKLKTKLTPILVTFTHMQMWTFTIDPELFDSPARAYDYVKERRSISRVINRLYEKGYLHSKRYFYVVEWQKNGMPHFHVLLDTSGIPFDLVCDLWNAYRPPAAGPVQGERPGFGSIRFSERRDFSSPEHAANYACKYLIKHPQEGYPNWVLDSKRRIRRYETSRGFWGDERPKVPKIDLAEVERPVAKDAIEHLPECFCEVCRGDVSPPIPESKTSTIRERLSKCKGQGILLRVTQKLKPGGEIIEEKQFVRNLPVSYDEILKFWGYETDLPNFLAFYDEQLPMLEKLMVQRLPRKWKGKAA